AGLGPLYELKMNRALEEKSRTDQLNEIDRKAINQDISEIAALEENKVDLEGRETGLAQRDFEMNILRNDFLVQISALKTLISNRRELYIAHLSMLLLFVLINVAPLLLSMLSRRERLSNVITDRNLDT